MAGLLALVTVVAVAWLVPPSTDVSSSSESGSSTPPAAGQASRSDPRTGAVPWEPTTPDPEFAPRIPTASGELGAVRVTIPSIGVDSPLVGLGVDAATGTLIPPERYDVAGVFTVGPVPGDVGPAIIAGHVDSRAGPGVFYRLEEIALQATITVSLADGQRIDFVVVEVAQYPKTAFPTAEVYGPTPGRELRLITCGGGFDSSRRSYLDNIVVYAVRA